MKRRDRRDARGRAEGGGGGGSSTGRDSRIGARGEGATGPGRGTWERGNGTCEIKLHEVSPLDDARVTSLRDRVDSDSESGLNLFLSSRLSRASGKKESREEREERDDATVRFVPFISISIALHSHSDRRTRGTHPWRGKNRRNARPRRRDRARDERRDRRPSRCFRPCPCRIRRRW